MMMCENQSKYYVRWECENLYGIDATENGNSNGYELLAIDKRCFLFTSILCILVQFPMKDERKN